MKTIRAFVVGLLCALTVTVSAQRVIFPQTPSQPITIGSGSSSGGGVSGLTTATIPLAASSTTLGDSPLIYNSVYAGGGSNPALNIRPSITQTGVGSAWILSNLQGPGKGSFPLVYIQNTMSPASDMSASEGGSTFKVRSNIASTNTHVATVGGIDIYVTIDDGNLGNITANALNAASLWVKNSSAVTIPYLFGATITAQNSGGSAATSTISTLLNALQVTFNGDDASDDVLVGTIADMVGINIRGAGVTNATVAKRSALRVPLMPGTATTDLALDIQATQKNLLTGSVGIGVSPSTKLHVQQNSGQGTYLAGYTGAVTGYVTSLVSASLTAIPAAVSSLIILDGHLVDQEVAFTSNPAVFTGMAALKTFSVVKSTDTAVYPAGSYLSASSLTAIYEGTGSIPNIYAAQLTTTIKGTGNIGTQAFSLLVDNGNSAASGTTLLAGGIRLNRPTSNAGRTTTTYAGLQIDNQTAAAGPGGTVYAIKQVGTTDLVSFAGLVSATTSLEIGTALLTDSATAPTISSGFGSSPSVASNNGTAAFRINVGTGGTAQNGVIGLPTATTGWNCVAQDLTTPASFVIGQTASSTTSATIQNYSRTTGTAIAWTASDILAVTCRAV